MIKQIFGGFCEELKALFDNTDVTVIRDTQFKESSMPVHTTNLVVLGLTDSPEVTQLSGGVTQGEYDWNIRVYFMDANAGLDEDFGVSLEGYDIIETVQNHLNKQQWLSNDFKSVVNNYSFKLTFTGMVKAQPLETSNGLIPGYQINYSSIALNTETAFTVYSDKTLQRVVQEPLG